MTGSGFRLLGHDEMADIRCRAPRNRQLLDYWLTRRRGRRLPRRADIDPADIPTLLPHIMVSDITYAPFRVRYRLVGTAIVEFAKFDFTGQYADELQFQDDDGFDYAGCYAKVAAAKSPGLGLSQWIVHGNVVRWIEFMICPLASDDQLVTQCIATEDYEPLSHLERESIIPVERR